MKFTAFLFFYCYIGLVLHAGFWGAFIGADFDQKLLFNLDTQTLPESTRIDLLSQYRFLRALEFGFGLFAILFRKEIFSEKKFNTLFLAIMGSGVLARAVSIVVDGLPSAPTWFFWIFELIGVIIIYLYSSKKIRNTG